MCGITGFYGFEDKALLKRMTDIITHRGPDDHGYFVDKNICMGHRRLSIIDLSEKGRQPLFNEDKSISIVFNGEIYNYKQLKESLEIKGHRFSSNTDTEVIVHGYEEYGEHIASMLNGDFAFAIWDSNKDQLYLARDYAGIKPLYYYLSGGILLFSSEIKSLLLSGRIKREIDYDAFYNFLTFRYVPGEKTLIKGVCKLLPGHYAIFSKNKLTVKKYWDMDFSAAAGKPESYYSQQIASYLKQSVKRRLMSDVPLGAYLSGGLDSSFVVGLMSELVKEPIKTFSVGFGDDPEYDETKYAKVVAERFGTDHHELLIDSSSVKHLPNILWHMDEPIADAAAVPTFLLSEFTKKKVSVVLTGEGADEVFGGYSKYKYMKMKNSYDMIPYFIRGKIVPAIASLHNSDFSRRMAEFSSSKSEAESYLSLISFFTAKEKAALCSEDSFKELSSKNPSLDIVSEFTGKYKNLFDKYQYLDFKTWLPDDVLTKVDKMTMAHALEARVPFLDREFLVFCGQIPSSLRVKAGVEKYILRKAMSDIVPKDILNRKKHGFNVPIKHWLDNELKEITMQVMSRENLANHNLYKYAAVENIFENYKKHKQYYSRQLWTLLNFEIWHDLYIKEVPAKKIII